MKIMVAGIEVGDLSSKYCGGAKFSELRGGWGM